MRFDSYGAIFASVCVSLFRLMDFDAQVLNSQIAPGHTRRILGMLTAPLHTQTPDGTKHSARVPGVILSPRDDQCQEQQTAASRCGAKMQVGVAHDAYDRLERSLGEIGHVACYARMVYP